MRRKVVVADHAEQDLESIGDYIARDNLRKAHETVKRIRQRIENLATFPERHRVQESLPSGHRFLIVGNYLAVYRIDETHVYIVRVIEGSRDLRRLRMGDDSTTT